MLIVLPAMSVRPLPRVLLTLLFLLDPASEGFGDATACVALHLLRGRCYPAVVASSAEPHDAVMKVS